MSSSCEWSRVSFFSVWLRFCFVVKVDARDSVGRTALMQVTTANPVLTTVLYVDTSTAAGSLYLVGPVLLRTLPHWYTICIGEPVLY